MPVMRYFLFVGAALLALLFVSNAALPKLPAAEATAAGTDKSAIRIRSDRKWPERVVFDTSLPTIVPAQAAKLETATIDAIVAAPTVAEYPAKARVRESFAQFRPSDDPITPQPKAQPKRKIAKSHAAPPIRMVAQQPQFGFFGNNTW